MKAENSTPMAVSPTPKAALIWLLLPRTMYWSMPSMNRVNPTTHMGQLLITMRRAVPAPAGAVRLRPRVAGASGRASVPALVLTTGPPPVARRSLPLSRPPVPGV